MNNELLKNSVRFFYDLQKLRIQSSNRASKKAEGAEVKLEKEDKEFLNNTGNMLKELEKEALKEIKRHLNGIPIYENFLKNVRGVGPTMSGVLVSEIDIHKCETPSQLWAWCGLATVRYCSVCNTIVPEIAHEDNVKCPKCSNISRFYHKADRKIKGQKCRFNPWLKSKVLRVLGESFIKSCNVDDNGKYYVKVIEKDKDEKIVYIEENGKKKRSMVAKYLDEIPYRYFYDFYKKRKVCQQVPICMLCKGTGKIVRKQKNNGDEEIIPANGESKSNECWNCGGTGGPAPWGCGKEHRHNAAMRYMVKQFLLVLWKEWRLMEGLSIRPPYAEEYLGKKPIQLSTPLV